MSKKPLLEIFMFEKGEGVNILRMRFSSFLKISNISSSEHFFDETEL